MGLALAGDLGWRGVACLLIEQTDGAIEQPKMDWSEPHHGVLPPLGHRGQVGLALSRAIPQDCVFVTSLTGYELGREPLPPPRAEKCRRRARRSASAAADMFDPILQRFVRTFPRVDAALSHRAGRVRRIMATRVVADVAT